MDYADNERVFEKIKNELKPSICESCRADGRSNVGGCKKCLLNRAYNKEYVETHLWVTDPYVRMYHTHDHDRIKMIPYHLPGENPFLYYGVEMEVTFDSAYVYNENTADSYDVEDGVYEGCMEVDEVAEKFAEITHGIAVFENDCTVENGFEIIFRPMSYKALTAPETVELIRAGFKYLKEQGAYVSQPEGNGMHVHISKKFFDYGRTQRNDGRRAAYQDIDWLFQFYQEELEKLGEREYTEYCQSKVQKAKKSYGRNRFSNELNAEIEYKVKLKKGGSISSSHDTAFIESGQTMEARIFRSTLDVETMLARVEIMRNFSHAVREGDIEGKTLNEILHTKDNLYLDNYINKIRNRCYIKNKYKLNLDKANTSEIEVTEGE